jgi:hypothetical protein
VKVLGESGASLFVEPLAPGAAVVTEGRALLRTNDRVAAKRADSGAARPAGTASAGGGRP